MVCPVETIVGLPHPFYRHIRRNTSCKIEPVIRREESSRASPLPFVGVAEPLAHGPAEKSRLPGADPDHRVDTGNIGKLELIDASLGIFGLFNGWVVEGSHVLCPANLLKGRILIVDGQLAELFLSPVRSQRVFGNSGISLAHIPRLAKENSNRIHLSLGQTVDLLQLSEENFISLFKRLGHQGRLGEKDEAEKYQEAPPKEAAWIHGNSFRVK